MANTTIFFPGPNGIVPVRVIDNGDGTYSLATGAAGGGAGTVTIGGPLGQAAMAASIPVALASNQSAIPVDTELPAAGALADGAANPTVPTIGVDLLLFNGATWDRARTPAVFKDLSAVTIDTIVTVWMPAAGKKIRLMGGVISASAAVNVLFEDNAAGAGNFVFRTPKLLADTPFVFTLGGNGKLLSLADRVLKATGSAAANITGTLYGTEE